MGDNQSGANVITHFPTPMESGQNELHLAVEENTLAINPNKEQRVYSADNMTMMKFDYLDKETAN